MSTHCSLKELKKEMKRLEAERNQTTQDLGTGMAESNTPADGTATDKEKPATGTPVSEDSGWSYGVIIALLAVIVIAGFLVYFYRTQYHRKS